MQDDEYRLAPRDHATLTESISELRIALTYLGRLTDTGETTEPAEPVDAEDVLQAGDIVGRVLDELLNMQDSHSEEDEERAAGAAMTATDLAEMDQLEAEIRDDPAL